MSSKERDQERKDFDERQSRQKAAPTPASVDPAGATYMSINEPPGSMVGGEGGGTAPGDKAVLTDLEPDTAEIGDEDLTMTVTGTGFTADCKILFNGGEEPTTFVSDTEVSTIVRPTSASVAGEYPVQVRNAAGDSDALTFEFTEPEASGTRKKGRR